jgi:hypothetical protein
VVLPLKLGALLVLGASLPNAVSTVSRLIFWAQDWPATPGAAGGHIDTVARAVGVWFDPRYLPTLLTYLWHVALPILGARLLWHEPTFWWVLRRVPL